jgi:hypothetical protein
MGSKTSMDRNEQSIPNEVDKNKVPNYTIISHMVHSCCFTSKFVVVSKAKELSVYFAKYSKLLRTIKMNKLGHQIP